MITVIRLAGPMLSWPSPSRYRYRYTEPSPTLSSIHGLLAAAAGVKRDERRPDWITDSQLAVRLDIPGSVLRDFHTINPAAKNRYRALSDRDLKKVRVVATADGQEKRDPVVTERYYRQGQVVTLFIEDEERHAINALSRPVFTLYAGRKACPLSFPVLLGQTELAMEDALSVVPATGADGLAEATLFSPPSSLSVLRRRVAPERPTGAVAESYALQERYTVLVNPPRVTSVFDVIDYLTGEDHVAQ